MKTKLPSDKLELLQHHAASARDLQMEIDSLEEDIKDKKTQLNNYQLKLMPDLMEELKIDHIGCPANGNKPAKDFKLIPYYSASISAKWSEDRRDAAFGLLKTLKAESLIKTEVSASLPKGSLKLAKQLVASMKKLKVTADLKQTVHAGTLTAWLREIYEGGQSLPQSDLEKIGGSVGRIVKAADRE